MQTIFRKLKVILGEQDLRRLMLLAIPITILAIFEVLSVFSILPFLHLATSGEKGDFGGRFEVIDRWFGDADRSTKLVWTGLAVLVVFGTNSVLKVITGWLVQKTIWQAAHHISMDLVQRYGRQPYEFFLANNSSGLIKKAIADIVALVSGVLMVGCKFFESLLKSIAVLAFLIVVNYKLALMAVAIFGGVYAVIHFLRHNHLQQLGRLRQQAIADRINSFTEVLSGIKSIRVAGALPWFVRRFQTASKEFSRINPYFQMYNIIPRSMVEFLAFGGIIGLIVYMLFTGQSINDIAPTLGVFALATYKLLPALSTAFAQAAAFSQNLPVIDDVFEDKQSLAELLRPVNDFASASPIEFQKSIELKNVSFHYQQNTESILRDVDLTIEKGMKVAVVGITGCGKSTLLDIVAGILSPVSGQLLVDGQPIDKENLYNWQRRLAYMPQHVFLCDDTIAANIAFGVANEPNDNQRLAKAVELAKVDQFLNEEFREGIETRVGENGVRLSGGQRQRIGLARAFYSRPEVLLLDEATSALDSITEEAVMSAIEHELPGSTVIMIAHRLSSTKFCDRIILMNNGCVEDSGTFDQLVEANSQFRQMVELAE